jgi:hypothetical protein
MGNFICCDKRKNYNDITSNDMDILILNKIKKKSKSNLLLKFDELQTSRRGDIVFCILMGASATITIIVICFGAAEPSTVSSLFVSIGASIYYGNEIHEKNKTINMYKKELENRN